MDYRAGQRLLLLLIYLTYGEIDEAVCSVEYTPLEGDALYEFSWAGSATAARAGGLALQFNHESKIFDCRV